MNVILILLSQIAGLGKNPGKQLHPVVRSLSIIGTSVDSLHLEAVADVVNPTEYSASISFADVHILVNGSRLGNVTVQNMDVFPGKNKNLTVQA